MGRQGVCEAKELLGGSQEGLVVGRAGRVCDQDEVVLLLLLGVITFRMVNGKGVI